MAGRGGGGGSGDEAATVDGGFGFLVLGFFGFWRGGGPSSAPGGSHAWGDL